MYRIKIHKQAKIILESDVVVINDKVVEKLQQAYPNVNVKERLELLDYMFTFKTSVRAENEQELIEKIKQIMSLKTFNKEMAVKLVGVPFEDYEECKKLRKVICY